jgi:hypothetical protein
MPKIDLLGDSILDNAAYTRGGPDVISQVRERLPSGWSATLLAVDGSTTEDIADQLTRVTDKTTHLVLSVGGNNALGHIGVLEVPAASVADAVGLLADVVSDFEQRYRLAVAACFATSLPMAVCTIYNGWFDGPFQRLATTMVALFNDVIIRVAAEHSLDVIDLRAVCKAAEDYANPIEPSSVGGAKIAQVIVGLVCGSNSRVPARVVS